MCFFSVKHGVFPFHSNGPVMLGVNEANVVFPFEMKKGGDNFSSKRKESVERPLKTIFFKVAMLVGFQGVFWQF